MTTNPLSLSVALVCKNNADTIGRTLESVAGLASEIVAVDSGSTDGTLEILQAHNVRVIHSPWLGHIRTKQLALEACREEWVFSIDSDESVEPELAASIRRELGGVRNGPAVAVASASAGGAGHEAITGSTPRAMGFEVNRKVYYRGVPLNHAWQPEWRLRLVRRARFRWAGLDPHDFMQALPAGESAGGEGARAGASGTTTDGARGVPPTVARLEGTLRHDSISTFADFFVKQASHAKTMARSLHAAGKRGSVARLLISPAGAFLKQVVLKQAWRDGYAGWLAASSTAVGTLMKHAVLIELSNMGPPAGQGDGPVHPAAAPPSA